MKTAHVKHSEARPIVELNVNIDQAKANGLNIKVHTIEDSDIPENITITLTGEHTAPLPTLNNHQCIRLHQDFDLTETNIEKLNDEVGHLMTVAIIKQRLKNIIS